jgi:phosphoribosylanthranilate isomerase
MNWSQAVLDITVKVCGLTRSEDVQACASAGADALGFVFARSPRRLSAGAAARLVAGVPEGLLRVGLFMDQAEADIEAVLERVELDLLQFHGRETDGFCAGFGLPFIKAISISEAGRGRQSETYPSAAGVLLDSHSPGSGGGTGRSFDWSQPVAVDLPLWLAGGLNPTNVGEAVRRFSPYAVDVSSGVEDAPGIKNHTLIKQFVQLARQE